MKETGSYPQGAEHDPLAPFNDEPTERNVTVETHLIPVWLEDDEQIDVQFKISLEDVGDEIEAHIVAFRSPVFQKNWNEDVKYFLEEISEKPIKLYSE